jgi:hypothetical protein
MADSERSLSQQRLKQVTKIVEDFANQGRNLEDPAVVQLIHRQVSEIAPLVPADPLKGISKEEIQEEVRKAAKKRYPHTPDELRKNLEAAAAEKFKLARPLSVVNVEYERGGRRYGVEGKFYSISRSSVKIDEKNIAFFDLTPESRAMFDKAFCEKMRQDWVEQQFQETCKQKIRFLSDFSETIEAERRTANEAAGYVWTEGGWATLRDLVETEIRTRKASGKVSASGKGKPESPPIPMGKTEKKPPESEPEKTFVEIRPAPVKSGTTVKPAEPVGKPDEGAEEPKEEDGLRETRELAEIRKRSEERQRQIMETYSGIDADQGYGAAIWGMTRKEVKMLFEHEGIREISPDTLLLPFADGPIEKVEIHFLGELFYRIIISFRIGPPEAMQRIAQQFKERYGETDEEKALRESESEQPEAPVKFVQKVHWTGTISRGFLDFVIRDDQSGFESFIFTKECLAAVQPRPGTSSTEEDGKGRETEGPKKPSRPRSNPLGDLTF